jgi:hypothetical protein
VVLVTCLRGVSLLFRNRQGLLVSSFCAGSPQVEKEDKAARARTAPSLFQQGRDKQSLFVSLEQLFWTSPFRKGQSPGAGVKGLKAALHDPSGSSDLPVTTHPECVRDFPLPTLDSEKLARQARQSRILISSSSRILCDAFFGSSPSRPEGKPPCRNSVATKDKSAHGPPPASPLALLPQLRSLLCCWAALALLHTQLRPLLSHRGFRRLSAVTRS